MGAGVLTRVRLILLEVVTSIRRLMSSAGLATGIRQAPAALVPGDAGRLLLIVRKSKGNRVIDSILPVCVTSEWPGYDLIASRYPTSE